jgi:hypothetical protein
MKCFPSKVNKEKRKIKIQKHFPRKKAPTNNSTPKIFQQIFTEKIHRNSKASKTGNF